MRRLVGRIHQTSEEFDLLGDFFLQKAKKNFFFRNFLQNLEILKKIFSRSSEKIVLRLFL